MTYKNLWFSCFVLCLIHIISGLNAPWWCEGHYSFQCTNSFGSTWTQGSQNLGPIWVHNINSIFESIIRFGFVFLVPLYLGLIFWIEAKSKNEPKLIRNLLIFLIIAFTSTALLNFDWLHLLRIKPISGFIFREPSFTLSPFFPQEFSPSIGLITLLPLVLLFLNELRNHIYTGLIRVALLISILTLLVHQYFQTKLLIDYLSNSESRMWTYHLAQGFWVSLISVIFLVAWISVKEIFHQTPDYLRIQDDYDLT